MRTMVGSCAVGRQGRQVFDHSGNRSRVRAKCGPAGGRASFAARCSPRNAFIAVVSRLEFLRTSGLGCSQSLDQSKVARIQNEFFVTLPGAVAQGTRLQESFFRVMESARLEAGVRRRNPEHSSLPRPCTRFLTLFRNPTFERPGPGRDLLEIATASEARHLQTPGLDLKLQLPQRFCLSSCGVARHHLQILAVLV